MGDHVPETDRSLQGKSRFESDDTKLFQASKAFR
jgi:hypothetical protein